MILRSIDFETTGMPEDGAAICEIGWCDVEATVSQVDPSSIQARPVSGNSFFVNPGVPMPPVARAVHHISDADVMGCDTPANGLRVLMQEPAPDYFVAHNAKFEQAFFDGGNTPWICTYKVAVRLWPDAPSHSNQVLRYWLELRLDEEKAMPPHRAGPDAYVTGHILALMLNKGLASLEEMARWSSGPPLLPKVMFGKHRGSKWEDIPTDYLEWLAFKSDMDSDIKANAKHHLKKRSAS